MNVCYIASAFRGKNHWEMHQNVLKAEAVIPMLIEKGYAPICPHKITENMQGLFPDEKYLEICMELLKRSDAILLLEGWMHSEGSMAEWQQAEQWGKEIFYEVIPDVVSSRL